LSIKVTGENAAVVIRGYEAFNAADIDALGEIFAADASWHTPGRSPVAGDYIGRDAVFGQFGRYGAGTAGTFSATLAHVYEEDDGRVVGLHRNSGEREGRRLDTECCIAFELSDGQITSGREFFFDLHNWDEFWS
jgi:ketosteroid isomerase-like protein